LSCKIGMNSLFCFEKTLAIMEADAVHYSLVLLSKLIFKYMVTPYKTVCAFFS